MTGALVSCAGLKDLKESGTIRMCDFVGIGLVLLEEVYHWGDMLRGLIYAQGTPSETAHIL